MAPIQMVSDDLLCYILLLSLTYSRDNGFITVHDRFTSVQVFTQVCFHWRSLVLSYPLLWSHISVLVTDNDDHSLWKRYLVGRMGIYITKCLVLSKQAPLCIKIQKRHGSWHSFGYQCLQTIARNSYRWETIDFGWGFMKTISCHILEKPTDFNNLKSLTLHDDQLAFNDNESEFEDSTLSFESAPALSHFRIEGINNPSRKLLRFPWKQITHFSARDNHLPNDDLLRILQSMPKLISFEYSGTSMISTPGRRITLPNLEQLRLYYHVGYLLEVLDTPGLVSLSLDRCSFGRSAEHTSLTVAEFLRRSTCLLQELKLSGISLDDGWDVEELNQLKRLHLLWQPSIARDVCHLTAQNRASWHPLFSALRTRIEGHHKYLFPQLERLDLHVQLNTGCAPNKVVDLLRSRLPSPSISEVEQFHLQSVTVNFYGELNKKELKVIKDFLHSDVVGQSGVDVTIRNRSSADSDFIITL
ncbi:hypothetical protein BDQ17DRAFT_1378994 [Cyathus striatus]|nr:hypothetical protein BDQ17DRAFT_1378994 [Cyathus striatus]